MGRNVKSIEIQEMNQVAIVWEGILYDHFSLSILP